MIPNTAVYRRVSTDHQDGSLETQEKRIDDYVRFKELVVTKDSDFSDEDTSGSVAILDRPGGAALFNLLKFGHIKHLVVAKLDRLARNAQDLLATVKALDEKGITLHIVDMGGDTLTTQGAVGKLMITILGAIAEFERELIRSRIKDRLKHKFEKGELIGTVPYGFDLGPDKTLVDNPEEQKWIHHMHRRRTVHNWSYKRVADELNELGVPTKTGKKWQCGNVAGVLQSKHTARLLAGD
jgi:site-specific DNA recombinase